MKFKQLILKLFNSNAFFIALLLLYALKIFFHYNTEIDLQLSDDGDYILYSFDTWNHLHLSFGPAYSIWLKVFHLISPNPISIFLYNYVFLCTLFPVLLYVFFTRIGQTKWAAFFVSFCVLTSEINLNNQMPHVTHFVLCLFLFGLILSTYLKNKILKLLVINFFILLSSYARPELFLCFILISVWIIYLLIRNFKIEIKINVLPILLFVGISSSLFFKLQLPVNAQDFGYNRSVLAFYQHYLINQNLHGNKFLDSIYYFDFIKSEFSKSKSLGAVITQHSNLFFKHVAWNSQMNILTTYYLLTGISFPLTFIPIKKLQLLIGALALLFVILLFVRKRKTILLSIRQVSFYLKILLIFSIPFCITSIIIFPRFHYIFAFIPLLSFLWVIIFSNYTLPEKIMPFSIILFGIVLFIMPSIANLNFIFGNEGLNPTTCRKKMVEFISKHYYDKKHVVFCTQNFVGYLPPNNFNYYQVVHLQGSNRSSFRYFVDSLNIDMIVVDEFTFQNKFIMRDTTWQNITQQSEINGFVKINPGICANYYLLLKK